MKRFFSALLCAAALTGTLAVPAAGAASTDATLRVGLTVGAKLGHAVERNRLRRRLREIYRLHEGQFARGYDIVVVARAAAMQAPYRQLEGAYLRLAGKLGIYAQQAQEETKDT